MAPLHGAITLGKENVVPARAPDATAAARSQTPSAIAASSRHGAPAQALIPAARAGDTLAFQGLVEAYWNPAARLARSILKTEEAAADAIQDALIKVYQAMPRFKDGNFRAWMLRIVANTCYDHLRRQKRHPTVSLEQMMEESELEAPDCRIDSDPEQCALRQEQSAFLRRMVNRLPAWYRDVVILVDIHDFDYGEAAAHLGLPRGTVKSRLSRARATLRDQLAESDLLRRPSN